MKKIAAFAVLSIAMTWPLARHLATLAPQHHDVFFNMWRLLWFAHALATSPAHLLDTNIFYPEPRTLTYSDAMFVQGFIAAPFVWAGMRPVLLHNLMLLLALTGCGVAMFLLVRYLTGSRGAGLIAGIVFTYAPYRFEHLMHMELQWAMWVPLAMLALHRVCDTGRKSWGLALGAFLALQMLSSIYYGIFLATFLVLAVLLLVPRDRTAPLGPVLKALVIGAIVGAVISGAYALPYLQTKARLGERSDEDVASWSASPRHYLSATEDNWLYGRTAVVGRPERHLLPGITPLLLALAGLLLRKPGRRPIVYLLLLVFAFEGSLGVRGYVYPLLHQYVPAYRGLRVPARLGLFVIAFLGVLAGYGYQAVVERSTRRARLVAVSVCVLALVAEYRVRPRLVEFSNKPPAVYRMLAAQPRGVLAEFPVPRASSLPGREPEYSYYSAFHWFPLVNGYSGMYPRSYLARLDRLENPSAPSAVAQLRRDQVRYVIVHGDEHNGPFEGSPEFVQLGRFPSESGHDTLYLMR